MPKTNSRNSGCRTTWAGNTGSSRPVGVQVAPERPGTARAGAGCPPWAGSGHRRAGGGRSQRPPGERDEHVLQLGLPMVTSVSCARRPATTDATGGHEQRRLPRPGTAGPAPPPGGDLLDPLHPVEGAELGRPVLGVASSRSPRPSGVTDMVAPDVVDPAGPLDPAAPGPARGGLPARPGRRRPHGRPDRAGFDASRRWRRRGRSGPTAGPPTPATSSWPGASDARWSPQTGRCPGRLAGPAAGRGSAGRPPGR